MRSWAWVMWLVTTASALGCTKVKFTIDKEARFSTGVGNVPPKACKALDPTPRTNEDATLFQQVIDSNHNDCSPAGQPCITGLDWVNRYEKIGGAGPTEYVFQYLDFQIRENRACNNLWSNMGSGPRLEFWPSPAFDTQASFRCAEGAIKASYNAVVGVIDITDLSSADEKLVRSIHSTSTAAGTINPAAVGNDVFNRIKDKVEKEKKIEWHATYEYDGCTTKPGGPGLPPVPDPHTSCGPGIFHCLIGGWTDSVGGGPIREQQ